MSSDYQRCYTSDHVIRVTEKLHMLPEFQRRYTCHQSIRDDTHVIKITGRYTCHQNIRALHMSSEYQGHVIRVSDGAHAIKISGCYTCHQSIAGTLHMSSEYQRRCTFHQIFRDATHVIRVSGTCHQSIRTVHMPSKYQGATHVIRVSGTLHMSSDYQRCYTCHQSIRDATHVIRVSGMLHMPSEYLFFFVRTFLNGGIHKDGVRAKQGSLRWPCSLLSDCVIPLL